MLQTIQRGNQFVCFPNDKKSLVLMMGVPGSGKTTFYETHLKDTHTLVSSDAIVERLGKENGQTYSEAFKSYKEYGVDAIFARELDQSSKGNVVVDRTNMSITSRRRFLSHPGFKDHHKTLIHFEPPAIDTPEYAEILKRVAGRPGKDIPFTVINKFIVMYEVPTLGEGFDQIIHLGPMLV